MSRTKQRMISLREFLRDRDERRKLAKSLADRMRSANRIAKIARTAAGRGAAYKVKTNLVVNALERFSELFRIESWEHHHLLGPVLLVRIPDGGGVHIPLTAIALPGLQLDLRSLPRRVTLQQKARPRANDRRGIHTASSALSTESV
jgi:hypothetical protein